MDWLTKEVNASVNIPMMSEGTERDTRRPALIQFKEAFCLLKVVGFMAGCIIIYILFGLAIRYIFGKLILGE